MILTDDQAAIRDAVRDVAQDRIGAASHRLFAAEAATAIVSGAIQTPGGNGAFEEFGSPGSTGTSASAGSTRAPWTFSPW